MEKRIARLEAAVRPGAPVSQIVILDQAVLDPATWDELRAADTAGDDERLADLAEAAVGVRPIFGGDRVCVIFDCTEVGEELTVWR